MTDFPNSSAAERVRAVQDIEAHALGLLEACSIDWA